jgi:hypothetical protein
MAGAAFRNLDFPFFTLEYRDGAFARKLPFGAEDLGGGRFLYGGAALALPEPDPSDPEHALALPRIGGKALLSLLRRGRHPLAAGGPRLADREEGLQELALDEGCGSGPAGPLRLVLRRRPGSWGLPLEGLPGYRFRDGVIYEIIGGAELTLLTESYGAGQSPSGFVTKDEGGDGGQSPSGCVTGEDTDAGERRFVLRGEEIPRFAGDHGRLVYRFGDPALRRRLSEEAVFVPAGELSLVLSVAAGTDTPAAGTGRGAERPLALPFLKRGGRRYPAREVSLRMDREFILLEDRWARREDLERAGLLPLGYYAGGEPIAPVRPPAHAFPPASIPFPPPPILRPPASVPSPPVSILPPASVPSPPASVPSPPAAIPSPPGRGGGPAPFFSVPEEKFRRLPTGDLLSELSLFGERGEAAPFVPPGSDVLLFDRMSGGERAYFLYWRGAFREGRAPETAEAYIRLYVRELCLFTGARGDPRQGAEKNFRELLRLWRSCREAFPRLDGDLLRWLYDYAVLYGIEDAALPLLFPFVHDGPCPPLADRYLYRTFIGENNVIGFADLLLLTGADIAGNAGGADGTGGADTAGGANSGTGGAGNADTAGGANSGAGFLPAKDYTAVVNGVDRFLRERFRLKLFEFFYPPAAYRERRRALEGLPLTGDSFYTDGGARFSLHRPLGAFLAALFRYVEYRGLKPGGEGPPPLEEPWRSVADAVLEGRDPMAPVRPGAIDRLREESDQVRDLLLTSGIHTPKSGVPAGLERRSLPQANSTLSAKGGQAVDTAPSMAREEGRGPVSEDLGPVPEDSGTAPEDRGPVSDDLGHVPEGSKTVPDGPGRPRTGPPGGDGGVAAFIGGLGALEAAALGIIAGGGGEGGAGRAGPAARDHGGAPHRRHKRTVPRRLRGPPCRNHGRNAPDCCRI